MPHSSLSLISSAATVCFCVSSFLWRTLSRGKFEDTYPLVFLHDVTGNWHWVYLPLLAVVALGQWLTYKKKKKNLNTLHFFSNKIYEDDFFPTKLCYKECGCILCRGMSNTLGNMICALLPSLWNCIISLELWIFVNAITFSQATQLIFFSDVLCTVLYIGDRWFSSSWSYRVNMGK